MRLRLDRQAFLTGGVAAGASALGARPAFAAKELPPLKERVAANIGISVVVSNLGFMAADKQGFFAKRNIAANVLGFRAGNEINEALLGGKADFAATGLLPAVLAYGESGNATRVISAYGYGGDRYSVIVREGSGIKSFADFPGKRVAVNLGTDIQLGIILALQANHIDPKQVQFVNMNYAAMIGAATRGDLDAYVENEPQGSQMLDALPGKVRLLTRMSPFFDAAGVFAVKKDWFDKQPLATQHIVLALWEGDKYVRDHPNEAAALMVDASKQLLTTQATLDGIKLTEYDPRFRPRAEKELQTAADLAFEDGKVRSKLDTSVFCHPAYDMLHALQGPYGYLLPK